MNNGFSIYVVEDEQKMMEILKLNLSEKYNVHFFSSAEDALDGIQRKKPDLIITDVRLPGMDGIELMEKIKRVDQTIPFIVFTGYGSIDHAVNTMRKGAFDYLEKPIKIENLIQSIDRVRSYVAVYKSPSRPLTHYKIIIEDEEFEFVTNDPATRQMLNLAQKASQFNSPILIIGETGTGKELCARFIHERSERKGPFVVINCASIPKDLLEGELFGYKKGAFTGAVQDYAGKIALSHQGTLFLDEIAELPLELQAKLLNVLEIPEYYPIGSNVKKKIDLNLITATNKNLRNRVEEGLFRSDLYYRVAVIPIKLPTLRERKCDIFPLVDYFLKNRNQSYVITPEAKLRLLGYSWPGNVRELRNVIERSMLLTDNENIIRDVIFDSESYNSSMSKEPEVLGDIPDTWEEFKSFKSNIVRDRRKQLERLFIEKLLIKNGGNISACARSAGIDRRQLQDMIKELNIDATLFREGRE
jgi:DNA-binding NtrC family response regulator